MNRRWIALGLTMFLGCDPNRPPADATVSADKVPAVVLDAARKALPGYKFDTYYKMTIDGKEAYEIRGKDARGKVREVEVSTGGEVLAIE